VGVSGELRVGLIGYGLAGRAFHAPLIAATDGLRLAAVVTSRREEVAERYLDARVLASVDELWDQCDLAVVAAPNRVHVELAEEAVRRGVAAVVDKPLAVACDQAEALVALARERDGKLTVFHNRRWDGDFLTLRRLLSEHALGPLVRLESRFERFRPQVAPEAWRERGDAAEGGGTLLDLGSHLVDQALVLLGPVVRVYAELARRREGVKADDDAFLALEHESGVHSHLSMGAVAPLYGPRFAVSGLRAGFATDGLDVQEEQLRAGMTPADPGFGETDRAGRLVDEHGERPVPLERGNYAAFYAGVVRWLRDGAPPPVPPGDAVAGLRVLDAARRSAADERVVELSPQARATAPGA
jgi:predicted dehydrogenase